MTTQTEDKTKDGITFVIILLVTVMLCAFIFIVLANVAGSALAALLGIGAAAAKC